MIKYFDKDGGEISKFVFTCHQLTPSTITIDGTVDGTEFLLLFTKLGFNEKTRRLAERRKEKERRDRKDKIWWEQRQREIEQNNAKKIDRSFTPAHKEIALGKIATCAADFVVNPINSLALQSFQGSIMEPHVFKDMLRR